MKSGAIRLVSGDRYVPWASVVAFPLKPLGLLARLNPETLPETTDANWTIRYVDIGNVNSVGRIENTEEYTFERAPSRARRIIREGDTIVSTVRTYLGAVAYVEAAAPNLVCSTGFAVLRPEPCIHPKFLSYWARSQIFIDEVCARSVGVSYPAIRPQEIAHLPAPLPSLRLQQEIADFLDHKTAAIDALIEKKERLIELIAEKHYSLTTLAATVGFNPNTASKDSGIPHLGKVASTWEIQPLRHRLRRIEQGWSPECDNRQAEDTEWGVLKVGCVNGGVFNEAENKALPLNLRSVPELEVRCGDVLVSRANTRELAGSVALVMKTRPKLLLCDKLFRLKYRAESVDPGYLALALRSPHARWQIEREATGASDSMQNIGQDTLKRLVLAWPPLEEQKRIAKKMYEFEQRNTKLAARIGRQIQLLREYRQASITAAVTGQANIPKHVEAA